MQSFSSAAERLFGCRAAEAIASALKPGCIVSDVGPVKQTVIADMLPHIPKGVHFVPAHPVAGTENSGPEAALLDPQHRQFLECSAAVAGVLLLPSCSWVRPHAAARWSDAALEAE